MGAFRFFIMTVSVKLIWWLEGMEQRETANIFTIFLFLPTELGGGGSGAMGDTLINHSPPALFFFHMDISLRAAVPLFQVF